MRSMELPTIMRKSFVCFCHLVRVLAFFNGGSGIVAGVDDFIRQTLFHRLLAAAARIIHEPTKTKRCASFRFHFYWHLIVRSAYAASLNLKNRHNILD